MKNIILIALLIGVFFPFDTGATPAIENNVIRDLRADQVQVEPVIDQVDCEPKPNTESRTKRPVRNFIKRLRKR